jgi:hypothetical protein
MFYWGGQRLVRLEEQLVGVRGDIGDLMTEQIRTRERLHNLEGVAGLFVEAQKENRRREEEQYQRLGLRVQVLTLVVGLAAIAVPLIVYLLQGK